MERDRFEDGAPQDELEDEQKDTEIERRAGPGVMHEIDPYPPRERGTAVYGDTDMDPNRDDQASAHRAEQDEHL